MTALRSAEALGFGRHDVAAVVRSISPSDFFKSMTSLADHRHWQDVYHVPWDGMTLYVKFTNDVVPELVVLSLKER